jgi:hypothetical protein
LSDLEKQFYVGLVVSFLCFIFTAISAYYQREAVVLMKVGMSTKKRNEYEQNTRWWWWPIIVMVLLSGSAWIPYWLTPENLSEQVKIMGWGPDAPNGTLMNINALQNLKVSADGSHASSSTREKYRMAAVALHSDGSKDPDDVEILARSAEHDIVDGNVPILLPVTERFRADYGPLLHWVGTGYLLLLVPKPVSMESFETIRQAKALGVKVVGTGGGPP